MFIFHLCVIINKSSYSIQPVIDRNGLYIHCTYIYYVIVYIMKYMHVQCTYRLIWYTKQAIIFIRFKPFLLIKPFICILLIENTKYTNIYVHMYKDHYLRNI